MTTRYGSASSSSNGTSPKPGRMRRRNWSEKTSEKSRAADDAATDPPAPEDHERDAHPAAAGDDVEREAAQQGERDERAADGHQRAADHQRQVAGAGHAAPRPRPPPRGSRRPRGSPARSSSAAGATRRPARRPGTRPRSGAYWSKIGADLAQAGERVRRSASARSAASSPPPKMSRFANSRQPDEADRQADARDVLVRAEASRSERHDRPGSDARPRSRQPGRAAASRSHRRPRSRRRRRRTSCPRCPRLRTPRARRTSRRPCRTRAGSRCAGWRPAGRPGRSSAVAPLAATSPRDRRRPTSPTGGADRRQPIAAQRQQGDRGQEQDALDDGAELRRDARAPGPPSWPRPRGRPGTRRGERDARHRERAQRRDDDPGVAVARREAAGQPVLDAGHLAHAGDARRWRR